MLQALDYRLFVQQDQYDEVEYQIANLARACS